MRPLTKIFYLSLLLLLAWLAAMPYVPMLRQEWAKFLKSWDSMRHENADAPIEPTSDASAAQNNRRERTIVQPKPVNPSPLLKSVEEVDPFIREARERAQADPEAAMQWLQEQSTGSERLRGMLEVVALWAAKDAESALLWLESNAQGLARLETLNSGVELWAERDPTAAANWIDAMANDGSKIAAAKSLAGTWAKSDPQAAAAWLESLTNGPIRQEAAGTLAMAWMLTDPANAAAWVKEEAQNSGDKELLRQTIAEYAKVAPEAAEAFLRTIPLQDPFDHQGYATKYIQARAENDPVATAEWLQSLPENDPLHSPENATHLLQVWAQTDSIAASAWLSEQPSGPERDAAIVGFAGAIQPFEPEAAATWANTISDPTQRATQLTQSIRSWARQQPDAALEWVVQADLAPAEKERLASEIGFD